MTQSMNIFQAKFKLSIIDEGAQSIKQLKHKSTVVINGFRYNNS